VGWRRGGVPCDGGAIHPKKLIVAAGWCAIRKEAPPPPLLLDWYCQKYHALPEAGGFRNQLAGDIERMTAASSVYNAVASWHRMFHGGGNITAWLERNRANWETTQKWMKAANYGI